MTQKEADKIDDVLYQLSDVKTGNKGMLTNKMMGVIKTALSKQIPKIPCMEYDGYSEGLPVYESWECPRCGFWHDIEDEYKYCPECGQAINWSEL